MFYVSIANNILTVAPIAIRGFSFLGQNDHVIDDIDFGAIEYLQGLKGKS
jgi:hypothetical protein